METILERSARYIDQGVFEGPESVNRLTFELHELGADIAFIEAFGHVSVFRTGEGLVAIDTSLDRFSAPILAALRRWSDAPFHTLAYTHGHVDHVGGAQAFVEDSLTRGAARPRVIAHENVAARFHRYDLTNGYNVVINERQFGQIGYKDARRFGPAAWVYPDVNVAAHAGVRIGELEIELHHAKGETDDHLWAWVPAKRAVCCGDLIFWYFPNAGNPQKVQRYPLEWARALREMAALGPELLLPAHGLPVAGEARIKQVLGDVASALETLVQQTLELMNAGATLDHVIHHVRVPAQLMDKPYLRPHYDEPEFVVRNIWRLYGGWYDANPARLKPAPDALLAREVVQLAGGIAPLVARARALASGGDLRVACHLIEMAVQAEPELRDAHAARAEIYAQRRDAELSLMARGIFGTAADESLAKLGAGTTQP
jgi:alkyl sulfatase BDS1-like metallo-beta-lactamase superfamily hydrolase